MKTPSNNMKASIALAIVVLTSSAMSGLAQNPDNIY
jgi:hypothetical protein